MSILKVKVFYDVTQINSEKVYQNYQQQYEFFSSQI